MAAGRKPLARDLRNALRRLEKLDRASGASGAKTRGAGARIAGARSARPSALTGQPFDALLLGLSPAFRKSRAAFLKEGGRHVPSLLSSPRSLSSPALLSDEIEYSALEREYRWVGGLKANDAADARLLDLRSHVTSLYHEQNHRILWRRLPPAPSRPASLRKYLNLAESLVIATDMALSDALGPKRARDFYLTGAIYDPGTTVLEEGVRGRDYRNYLHAAFYATYLNLELYDPKQIPRAIEALFPTLGPLAGRAAARASNLDGAFIARTNLAWQKKNSKAVIEALASPPKRRGPALELPDDPMDNRLAYLIGEPWFAEAGF